jgi:hypothetical protein
LETENESPQASGEADVLVNNPTAINGAAVRAEGGVVRSIL